MCFFDGILIARVRLARIGLVFFTNCNLRPRPISTEMEGDILTPRLTIESTFANIWRNDLLYAYWESGEKSESVRARWKQYITHPPRGQTSTARPRDVTN